MVAKTVGHNYDKRHNLYVYVYVYVYVYLYNK